MEELDSRLPPVGTTLVKRDRRGVARCECTIEDAGKIRYGDTVYSSLSAAASAAAAYLGLTNRVNGFVFWGLVKPARATVKPADRLRKISARYEAQLSTLLQGDAEEVLKDVRKEALAHASRLRDLVDAA